MSTLRSTIFEIGGTLDAWRRGEEIDSHMHKLQDLRMQLKWMSNNDFPLPMQMTPDYQANPEALVIASKAITSDELRRRIEKYVYFCISNALHRGPSQAGTESNAERKESAETSPESKTPPSKALRDEIALAALPEFIRNALNHKKFKCKEDRLRMLQEAPKAAYQIADLTLKARST